jgi:hypothetical protein
VTNGSGNVIDLELDGVIARAVLWPELAPKSVAALVAVLPLEADLQHCKWSGEACFADLPAERLGSLEGLESPATSIYPGTLALRPPNARASGVELLASYGIAEYRWPDGRSLVSPIGELTGDAGPFLAALASTGWEGRKRLRIRAVEVG